MNLPYGHRADITVYEGTRYIDCPCGWLKALDIYDDLGDILRFMEAHLASEKKS